VSGTKFVALARSVSDGLAQTSAPQCEQALEMLGGWLAPR
jgi:hypothetical protein